MRPTKVPTVKPIEITPKPSPRPTWDPTGRPTWHPTPKPTTPYPTMKPTEPDCNNNVYYKGKVCENPCEGGHCNCYYENQDPHCQVCQIIEDYGQCTQCKDGYFKLHHNNKYKCQQCQEMFGNECLHCSNSQGCQQCENGYVLVDDPECNNVKYCIHQQCQGV